MDIKNAKRQVVEVNTFMGTNVLDDPNTLDPSESPYIINMDITKSGQMISRYGYEKVCELEGTGGMNGLLPFYRTYDTNKGDYLVFIHKGNIYRVTNENFTPVSIGTHAGDNVLRGITYNNVLAVGNGTPGTLMQMFDGNTMTDFSVDAPVGRYFGSYANWLFVTGVEGSPNTVYYPENEQIDTNWEHFPVKEGDGDVLTGLFDGQNRLTLFKGDGTFGVNYGFDDEFNISSPRVMPDISYKGGAIIPGSIQMIYGYFYFLSRHGFQIFGPSSESLSADLPLPLSLKITPLIRQINIKFGDRGSSAFFDEKYLAACPVGPQASTSNYIFVYNESVKRRFGKDNFTVYKDIPVDQFAIFRNMEKKDELYFTCNYAPILYKFNQGFSDDGYGYERTWRSKTFQFGERTTWEYLDLYGYKTLGSTIYLTVNADGSESEAEEITDENLITEENGGGYIGDNYIGNEYIGDGYFSDNPTPLYRWRKRYRFTPNTKQSYNMYFQLSNNAVGEGWGLSSYKLVYIPEADDPAHKTTD